VVNSIEPYLPAAAVVLLAGFVARWHKPWIATVALAAFLVYRDFDAGRTPVHHLLHLLIYLSVGGVLFWAVDRSSHLVLTLGLVLAGACVVLYLL
jgi:hypothetical protein